MNRDAPHIADDLSRGVGLLHLQIRVRLQAFIIVATIVVIIALGICTWTTYHLSGGIAVEAAEYWYFARYWTNSLQLKDLYFHPYSTPETWTTTQISTSNWFAHQAAIAASNLKIGKHYALIAAPFLVVGLLIIAKHLGAGARHAKLLRGRSIVSDSELAFAVEASGMASDLKVGPIPLIKGKETQHTLVMGTVGSGKTQTIFGLLDAIRARGDLAIIYDIAGSFVPSFYQPNLGDKIINPLDSRSVTWSPWAEYTHDAHPDRLAASLIPAPPGPNDFFPKAARVIYSTALSQLRGQPDRSVLKLLELLTVAGRVEKYAFFQGTEAAKFYEADNTKTSASIDSTLAVYARTLRFLSADAGKPGADFSISDFVKSSDRPTPQGTRRPWLFITSQRDNHEAVKPLITCLLDSAVAALLSMPENLSRRVWFILDELDSLNELPSLSPGLQEGRKYGGCFVTGIQDSGQLLATYGDHRGSTILGLHNTNVILRLNSKVSAEYASFILGKHEIEDSEESARYGAARRIEGLTLNTRRSTEEVVIPTQIMDLKDLELYIKLPGGYPVAKTRLPTPKKHDRPKTYAGYVESDLSQTAETAIKARHTPPPPSMVIDGRQLIPDPVEVVLNRWPIAPAHIQAASDNSDLAPTSDEAGLRSEAPTTGTAKSPTI